MAVTATATGITTAIGLGTPSADQTWLRRTCSDSRTNAVPAASPEADFCVALVWPVGGAAEPDADLACIGLAREACGAGAPLGVPNYHWPTGSPEHHRAIGCCRWQAAYGRCPTRGVRRLRRAVAGLLPVAVPVLINDVKMPLPGA